MDEPDEEERFCVVALFFCACCATASACARFVPNRRSRSVIFGCAWTMSVWLSRCRRSISSSSICAAVACVLSSMS
ncbi:hypothetical protein CQR48_0969 [Bifidobacterium thermophilum]|nr:hypothetical protein CQR48_0969 [Bifidobacterium thermophilum]